VLGVKGLYYGVKVQKLISRNSSCTVMFAERLCWSVGIKVSRF